MKIIWSKRINILFHAKEIFVCNEGEKRRNNGKNQFIFNMF